MHKYTFEQRQKVSELYWTDRTFKEISDMRLDRPNKMKYRTGKFTLKQIEKMTGVHQASIVRIARQVINER